MTTTNTTVRNLTPHTVTLYGGGAVDTATSKRGDYRLAAGATPTREFPADGVVARAVEVGGEPSGYLTLAGDPTVTIPLRAPVRFAATIDLPAPVEGIALIVSLVTADAARAEGRDCFDLFVVGDVVRDAAGRITGCLTLRRVTIGEFDYVEHSKKLIETGSAITTDGTVFGYIQGGRGLDSEWEALIETKDGDRLWILGSLLVPATAPLGWM